MKKFDWFVVGYFVGAAYRNTEERIGRNKLRASQRKAWAKACGVKL